MNRLIKYVNIFLLVVLGGGGVAYLIGNAFTDRELFLQEMGTLAVVLGGYAKYILTAVLVIGGLILIDRYLLRRNRKR